MPTTNQSRRKNPSFKRLLISCVPSKLLLTAKALKITISRMPRISSKMRTERTPEVNFLVRNPKSSNALYMIVVEDIANIPPRKRRSILLQPKRNPTLLPTPIIHNITQTAATIGPMPIFIILLKENSRPRVNMRNMTPI